MVQPTPTNDGRGLQLGAFSTITEALDHAALGQAGANFYSVRGELIEALPYRVLRDHAVSLARRFLKKGFRRRERVALIAETDSNFLHGFFACTYAGLIPVPLPLPTAFGGRENYVGHIRGMMEAADVSAVLFPETLNEIIRQAAAEMSLRFCGCLAELEAIDDKDIDLPIVTADDLAYLQFSSGSTRFPLGVSVTHAAALANARGVARDGLGVRDGDRCNSWLPFYHDMGLVGFMLAPMASQLSIDYVATRDFARRPLLWLQLISRNRATISYSPSFGYELCARRARNVQADDIVLDSWRVAGIGGDMIRPHVLRDFAETFSPLGFDPRAFVASYGMAEATLAVSFAPLRRGLETECVDLYRLENEARAVPLELTNGSGRRSREFSLCGHVLPEHAVEIRREGGALCKDREVGRVFVRGPSLMSSYFQKHRETMEVLSDDGWLDTGDLGYFMSGALVIVGRAKDLILVNGRNVWPQDLEWAVEREVPNLRSGDVAAISVDDGKSEHVVLLVECRAADNQGREHLCLRAGEIVRVAAGIDCTVVPVPPGSLPMTSSGKLARSRARTLYLAGALTGSPPLEPRDRPELLA
jgi:fatty-acyl-CoA synthase